MEQSGFKTFGWEVERIVKLKLKRTLVDKDTEPTQWWRQE